MFHEHKKFKKVKSLFFQFLVDICNFRIVTGAWANLNNSHHFLNFRLGKIFYNINSKIRFFSLIDKI